ncbi:hypothetical protein JCM10908_004874 [Rhodotorula pacifica]|uniref:signal peptidase complex catalytic subunit SEC11 n=1 Tax=Rhodotorula pacifica TaxID=1495444 RepID=UPI00316C418C
MFGEELAQLRRLGIRHALTQALNFALVLSTALMMWKGLAVICNTDSPVVVVLTESMEPAIQVRSRFDFMKAISQMLTGVLCPISSKTCARARHRQRGDLLFLTMPRSTPLKHGDITIYKVPGAPIPIVHRVIETHNEPDNSDQWILTKGDNNPVDDVGLYRGMRYLKRSHLVGKVQGYVPYVGYGTILMNDYPKLKYALLAILGGGILLQRE